MQKSVVLVGALDTKGAEFAFVRDLIRAQGVETILVDFGVLDDPPFTPDITNDAVARAGGSSIAALRSQADKTAAMRTMTAGLTAVVAEPAVAQMHQEQYLVRCPNLNHDEDIVVTVAVEEE